jgi:LAS superfamily LD-carboxypeptidase LdcB
MAQIVAQEYLFPRIERWLALCREHGIFIRITSSYRSPEKQRRLYEAYLARGRRGLPAAAPGHSLHETGEAIDFTARYNPTYGRRRGSPQTHAGLLAEAAGFRWGGRFTKADPVHIDAGYAWRDIG